LRGDYAEFFASTDKGYITNELWDSVIEKFLNTVTLAMNSSGRTFSSRPPYLSIPRESSESFLKIVFIPCFYLLNMTYFMQPLDDVVFGCFKLAERNETFFRISTGQQLDDLAPTAVYKAAKESFKSDVIVASWKRTGM
jgi:hypothetical protein